MRVPDRSFRVVGQPLVLIQTISPTQAPGLPG